MYHDAIGPCEAFSGVSTEVPHSVASHGTNLKIVVTWHDAAGRVAARENCALRKALPSSGFLITIFRPYSAAEPTMVSDISGLNRFQRIPEREWRQSIRGPLPFHPLGHPLGIGGE